MPLEIIECYVNSVSARRGDEPLLRSGTWMDTLDCFHHLVTDSYYVARLTDCFSNDNIFFLFPIERRKFEMVQ